MLTSVKQRPEARHLKNNSSCHAHILMWSYRVYSIGCAGKFWSCDLHCHCVPMWFFSITCFDCLVVTRENEYVHKLSYLRWAQRGRRSGRVGRRGEWPTAAGGSVWCFYLARSLRWANWERPLVEAEGTLQTLHGLWEKAAFQKLKRFHLHRKCTDASLENKAESRHQTHSIVSN